MKYHRLGNIYDGGRYVGEVLMADLIIENGTIITLDSSRRIIENGSLVIQNHEIEAVGKSGEIRKLYSAEKSMDAKGKFIFPGFINTHTHYFQTLLKGLGDDQAYTDWFPNVIGPSSAKLTSEDCHVAALLGCLDAIRSGTTCTLDFMYAHPQPNLSDEIIRAFQEIGIRGILARGIVDTGEEDGAPPEIIQETKAALNDCERLFSRYHGLEERIYVWIAPCSIWTVTRECLEDSRKLAAELNTRITTHVSEVPFEIGNSLKRFGLRDLEFMNRVGLTGPDMLAVHCVQMTDRDIRILKDRDVKVSHNPVCNMYMSSGVAPIPRMLEAGITVGLGVDGAASNNNQDMIQTFKISALLHKVNSGLDPTSITCEKVLEMGTIDGARALGLEREIGSIEPGKKADIVIMDFMQPNTVPTHHPVSALVYSATNSNVETVVVNGRVVMENRKILTIDEHSVLEIGRMKAEALMERAGIRRFKDRAWRSIAY